MATKRSGNRWKLDPTLNKDTMLIDTVQHAQIRLMNDKRWPWIIIVPMQDDLADLDDMPLGDFNALAPILHRTSAALKAMGVCTSTNLATIGNVVGQMHWHVIGRIEGDPNWPAPVWGYEKAIGYGRGEAEAFISDFREAFRGSLT